MSISSPTATRYGSITFGAVLLSLTGCAAFGGYEYEPASPSLSPSLRGKSLEDDASVDLSASREQEVDAESGQAVATGDGSIGNANEGSTGGRKISLSEALAAAQEDSYAVLEAMAQLDVASGRVQEADGALLPGVRLDIGGSYLKGRDINNAGQVLDGLDYGRFEPSVSVFYRINPGAALSHSKRLRREVKVASYEAREATRTAMLQAGVGYLDLVLSHASHQIAQRLVTDAARFTEITQARAAADIGAGADVARAESESARARQVALRARGRWQQASVRLAVLLRKNPDEFLLPAEELLKARRLLDEADHQELGAEAAATRPDVQAAQERASAASTLESARLWELLGPELDAGVRERLIGRTIDDLNNTTLAHVFLGFSFDFEQMGRLRAAKGEARAAQVQEKALQDRVKGEVAAAVAEVRTARDAIPEAKAGVEAAERSYRIQLDRFQAGTGLGLEVIDAQNGQARARRELAEAIVLFNVAQVRLAASIGHLNPELLAHSRSSEVRD